MSKPMSLAAYMNRCGYTDAAFAKACGISPCSVFHARTNIGVGQGIANKIRAVTGDKIEFFVKPSPKEKATNRDERWVLTKKVFMKKLCYERRARHGWPMHWKTFDGFVEEMGLIPFGKKSFSKREKNIPYSKENFMFI